MLKFMSKLRMIKYGLISKLQDLIYSLEFKKMRKIYPNYDKSKFVGHNEIIWAVKSYDDLTDFNPSIYTMNDFEIWYNHQTKTWSLDIEQIYSFDNGVGGQTQYLTRLLELFTKWMIFNGYKITEYPTIYDKLEINMTASSIERLYLNFRMYVSAFAEINNEIYI